MPSKAQKDININGNYNKVVNGDYVPTTNIYKHRQTKLSKLFEDLKKHFESDITIAQISQDLMMYKNNRDTIGLEEKLKKANKENDYDEYSELKQVFAKKLELYENFEPAQEIFSYILAKILSEYRNKIKPLIAENAEDKSILAHISNEITNPILDLINENGCDDIMGLSATEIEGMYHYLTGKCHIKWNKNDLSSNI